MGSHFFQKQGAKGITGSNTNLQARAIGASSYASRTAGMGAQKDVAAASAINKNKAPLAKSERSTAYPKGPKL